MTLSLEEKKVMYLLSKGADYKNFFFARAKSLKWLSILRDQYFTVECISYDEEDNTVFWPPLNYLEKVAIQINENPEGKEGYANEMLKIIDELVEYSFERQRQNKKPINHPHIWWYVVKILIKIPDAYMISTSITQFDKWIQAVTDHADIFTDLASDELLRNGLPRYLKSVETYKYAEAIVKAVTQIRSTRDKKTIGRHQT